MLKNIQKAPLSLDGVCSLLALGEPVSDEVGNQIVQRTERTAFCAQLPASRSEFYAAGKEGIRAEYVLAVDSEEYAGEEQVRYKGITHTVYRVYPRPDGFTELYLTQKAGASDGR